MMLIGVLIIYGSFMLDFWVWPVKSDVSAYQQIKKARRIHWPTVTAVLALFSFVAPLIVLFWIRVPIEAGLSTWLGFLIAFFGRGLTLWSALQMQSPHGLKQESIYAYTRNPINIGLFLTLMGLCLIMFNNWLWIGWLVFVAHMHYRVLEEEELLTSLFGEDYLQYKSRTPRYL